MVRPPRNGPIMRQRRPPVGPVPVGEAGCESEAYSEANPKTVDTQSSNASRKVREADLENPDLENPDLENKVVCISREIVYDWNFWMEKGWLKAKRKALDEATAFLSNDSKFWLTLFGAPAFSRRSHQKGLCPGRRSLWRSQNPTMPFQCGSWCWNRQSSMF